MFRTLRSSLQLRLGGAVALLALVAGSLALVATPARAAEPGVAVAPATAALDWLSAEVLAHDGMLTVSFDGTSYPDPGLTLDAVLALAAGGRADDPAVDAAVAALPAQMGDYITGFAGGTARAAGATAKTLLVELVVGRDVSPDFDLEADLRDLMTTTGDQTGRFQDREGFGDYSNGLGQSLAVLALARTGPGVPAEALTYLLAQQCSDGSFRLYYDPGASCTDTADGDPDATALALMGLLAVPSSPAIGDGRSGAVTYLTSQQQPSGGITGTGALNSNTTGLSAAALRAAGQSGPADAAGSFVRSLQWTSDCADLGAVAYDGAALAAGPHEDRPQWTRATAQGSFALGLPAYGAIGSQAPVGAGLDPISCPAAPAPAPPTTASPSPSVPGLGAGTGASPGADLGAPSARTLPATGNGLGPVAAIGVALVAAGWMLVVSGRRRQGLEGGVPGRASRP